MASKALTIPGKILKPGENVFAINGPETSAGALVRVVVSFTRGSDADIPARDNGVKVERTISVRQSDGTWTELKSGATVPMGSYLKIRVTASPQTFSNFTYTLLENPKPAGGETVPATDSRFPASPDAQKHVLREDRDAMSSFHYEHVAGTVAAEYVVLAELAGELHISPAHAELMYRPAVCGYSSSFKLNVAEKKP